MFLEQLRDASVLKAEPSLRSALLLLTAPPYSAHLFLEHAPIVSHAVFRQHRLHFRQQVNLGHINSFPLTHPHHCWVPSGPSLPLLMPSPGTPKPGALQQHCYPQSLQTRKTVVFLFIFFCPVLLESNRFFLLALTMTYLSWQYNLNNRRAMWTGPTVHSEWVLLRPSYWINTYTEETQAKHICLSVNYQPGNYYCHSILRSL